MQFVIIILKNAKGSAIIKATHSEFLIGRKEFIAIESARVTTIKNQILKTSSALIFVKKKSMTIAIINAKRII